MDELRGPRRRSARTGLAGLLLSLLLLPASLRAQLRPYEPFRWEAFDDDVSVAAEVGAGWLTGQRASLTGSEGRLVEAGQFRLLWRSGRFVLEGSGTVRRFFAERDRFDSPFPEVLPSSDGHRSDSGDYLVTTTALLTSQDRPLAAALRFGTRLPTTDNTVGLERDRTDFFALLLGRANHGSVRASAGLGVGVHGTRMQGFEQSDMLVFALGLERTRGSFRPSLHLVGHADGLANRTVRGNEELAELRLGFRLGDANWLRLDLLRGLTDFSPQAGLLLAVGFSR